MKYVTSQHKDLTSQHKDRTRRHEDLISQHNYLTANGRCMPPKFLVILYEFEGKITGQFSKKSYFSSAALLYFLLREGLCFFFIILPTLSRTYILKAENYS